MGDWNRLMTFPFNSMSKDDLTCEMKCFVSQSTALIHETEILPIEALHESGCFLLRLV